MDIESNYPHAYSSSVSVLCSFEAGAGGRHDIYWRAEHAHAPIQAFVALRFDPGEAYQFDRSHEAIELAGMPRYGRSRRARKVAVTRSAVATWSAISCGSSAPMS